MSTFTINIHTDNSFYRNDDDSLNTHSVIYNLNEVIRQIEEGDFHPGHTSSILDGNGNRVGGFKIIEDF